MTMFERVSLIVTGVVYAVIGFLIITQPKFLYYGVAAAFFVQGISSLLRAAGVARRGE